nr:PEP-CTERM sorting domain-containing protein [uncultured Albidiferax sp.]
MKKSKKIFNFIACILAASVTCEAKAMLLTRGDIYTSNYFSNTISHYDVSGTFIDSLTLPSTIGSEVKGLSFGDNGQLYAVTAKDSGFNVVAIDGSGTVSESYSAPGYIAGNLSYGKIAFGANGNFYVAGANNLVAFTRGVSQGTVIRTDNQMFDVDVLPSGNLLSLSAYGLNELSPTGDLVRNINTSIMLGDARGVEFNPATGKVFITMLGYTGQYDRLMRFDLQTGQIEKNESFWYSDDMALLADGRLLVGSRTQAPGLFDQDLNLLESLGSQQQMFVTQMPFSVPEPGTYQLMLVGGLLFAWHAKRSSSKRPRQAA